jgi:hypothetical protein
VKEPARDDAQRRDRSEGRPIRWIIFRLRFLDGIDPALLLCAHIVHSSVISNLNGRSEEGTMAAKKKAAKKKATKKAGKGK